MDGEDLTNFGPKNWLSELRDKVTNFKRKKRGFFFTKLPIYYIILMKNMPAGLPEIPALMAPIFFLK